MNYSNIYDVATEGFLKNVWQNIKYMFNKDLKYTISSNVYDLNSVVSNLKSTAIFKGHLDYVTIVDNWTIGFIYSMLRHMDYKKGLDEITPIMKKKESDNTDLLKKIESIKVKNGPDEIVKTIRIQGQKDLLKFLMDEPILFFWIIVGRPHLEWCYSVGRGHSILPTTLIEEAYEELGLYSDPEKNKEADILIKKHSNDIARSLNGYLEKTYKPVVTKLKDLYKDINISIKMDGAEEGDFFYLNKASLVQAVLSNDINTEMSIFNVYWEMNQGK